VDNFLVGTQKSELLDFVQSIIHVDKNEIAIEMNQTHAILTLTTKEAKESLLKHTQVLFHGQSINIENGNAGKVIQHPSSDSET